MRCDKLRLLESTYSKTPVGHNPIALAIIAFCMESKIIERQELAPLRDIVAAPINWQEMSNPLTSTEARRKKYRTYQPAADMAPLYAKFDEFLRSLKTDFNELFQNGKIIQVS